MGEQMSTENATAQSNVIDLSIYANMPKSKEQKEHEVADKTAFSRIDAEAENFMQFIGAEKLNYLHTYDETDVENGSNGKFYLSTINIKRAPIDILEAIVRGEKDSAQPVYCFEGSISDEIGLNFYSKEGPKTKAHSHGFVIHNGEICFIAQQGSSVKRIVICKA